MITGTHFDKKRESKTLAEVDITTCIHLDESLLYLIPFYDFYTIKLAYKAKKESFKLRASSKNHYRD